MSSFTRILLFLSFLHLSLNGWSQSDWPKTINTTSAIIKIYQPQIENYQGNQVKARGAFSILQKDKEDPVFGALWIDADLLTDRSNRTAVLDEIKVREIRFAGDSNIDQVNNLKALLEKEIPKWDMTISLDQLEASIEGDGKNNKAASSNLSTAPPKIIYSNQPSTLVVVDGEPKFQENKEMGVEMVMNTAFTIAKIKSQLYLNGSGKWYVSPKITGPWTNTKYIPKDLEKLNQAILENDKKETDKTGIDSSGNIIPQIIVSTEPAELLQSNGEADFAAIQGTGLLYMTNTNNDIFMNIGDQQYYVLLSGRWYVSGKLLGPWTYVDADKLPADFAKIPVDSEKDNVLSSVAGTDQAQDAVMDAQIPQTAKVDRSTTTVTVNYNGEPQFKSVDGTSLQYAVNTDATVLKSGNTFYCVDKGIWFQATTPKGPWSVSETRPAEVEKIPATVPVYNVKYVYIYETTPKYVYVGYTPGYTGSYIYGPTVIYGTGYYYNPWFGPYYYPRPWTYGYSMHYNPYYGWSMGFHYSAGWFSFNYYRGGYHGGYWGPPMYRPPYYHRPGYPPYYRPPYYPRPGYRPPPRPTPYPNRPVTGRPVVNPNIYNNNRGVTTMPTVRPMPASPSTRPSTGYPNNRLPSTQPSIRPAPENPNNRLPSTQPSTRPAPGNPNNRLPSTQPSSRPGTDFPNNRLPANNQIMTDRQGNVFQRDGSSWQQRTNSGWQNVNPNRQSEINRLNQQQQTRDRGNMRTNNFNQSRPVSPAPRSAPAQRSPSSGRR